VLMQRLVPSSGN